MDEEQLLSWPRIISVRDSDKARVLLYRDVLVIILWYRR